MDIMELGAIGELVGGAAVLVTLVYLALQVRQGTSQSQLYDWWRRRYRLGGRALPVRRAGDRLLLANAPGVGPGRRGVAKQ
jgi:hypothetical protein